MDIAREDWLLVFIVAAAVLPLGYSAMTSSSFTPQTEIEKACVADAEAVEANASFASQIRECRCIPPSRVDEDRFSTPREVKDAAILYLISCTLNSGEEMDPFPVWRIPGNYTGDLNQTNASVLRDSP